MSKSVATKIGIKQNMRAIFISAPADAVQSIDPTNLEPEASLTGNFDYIHFFAESQATFHQKFPKLTDHFKHDNQFSIHTLNY